jgi:ATP-dependent Lon protease
MNSTDSSSTPIELPVLPIKNTVIFPKLLSPLAVGRPASRAAVEAALASVDKTLVVLTQRDPADEGTTLDALYGVGTRVVVKRMARSAEGIELLVQGLDRVVVERAVQTEPYVIAAVRALPVPEDTGTEIEALVRTVKESTLRVLELANPALVANFEAFAGQASDPIHLAYLIGSALITDFTKEQAILEATTMTEALRLLQEWLAHEAQVLEVKNQIASKTESELSKEQRDFFLRRQLKAIHEELGDGEGTSAEAEALRKRLEEMTLPDDVRKEALRELDRLEDLPSAAPDYQLIRTYLELILELPWTTGTVDDLNLIQARQILNDDHFDLDEVKDRIIEHLAVLKLNPNANAPILCFVGPPGVGKTSLGQSIARAMGRKFERLSLGGLHDEAELRGHRRTYIGAMPGRIIQAIRPRPCWKFSTPRRTTRIATITSICRSTCPKSFSSPRRIRSIPFPGRCWIGWKSWA